MATSQKLPLCACLSALLPLCALLLLSSCAQELQTGLTGQATHVGTATLYRAQTAWPCQSNTMQQCTPSQTNRFVPLLHKHDPAGYTEADVIKNDEQIMLRLNSAFIKYFKEIGRQRRKGEIVVVVSFDSGSNSPTTNPITKAESFVIFGSKRQTLGSLLDLDDWPLMGPISVPGNDLLMRIVIIESDKQQNSDYQRLVKLAVDTASVLQPSSAMLLKVAQPIADLIISSNGEDVLFDHRFALHRKDGGTANRVGANNSLLFGTYVLLQQEDFLSSESIANLVPQSGYAPSLSEMRLDRHSNRLHRLIFYNRPTNRGQYCNVADISTLDAKCTDPEDFTISLTAQERNCNDTLGISHVSPGPHYSYKTYNAALIEAFRHNQRGTKDWKNNVECIDMETGKPSTTFNSCPWFLSSDYFLRYHFQYPTLSLPLANAILPQYALHTHLVFTIEKWNADVSGNITTMYTDYVAYNTRLLQLGDSIMAAGARRELVLAAEQYANATQILKFAKRSQDSKAAVQGIADNLCLQNGINQNLGMFADALLREASSLANTPFANCAALTAWLTKGASPPPPSNVNPNEPTPVQPQTVRRVR